jgi:NAD(P)-dependent dehydrogenase (short-subunit alcohol dehydrogenase family)
MTSRNGRFHSPDPSLPLRGKAILITGAGRGIGEAYARLCADLGARVFLVDLNPDTVSTVSNDLVRAGHRASWSRCDVSDPADASAAVDACVSIYGRIDGLVNNAALYAIGEIGELDDHTCRKIVEVNVLGVIYPTHAAIRAMRRTGCGSIVNVTSGAQAGIPYVSIYGATKGAVASFTYGAAIDLAGTEIRINAMSPLAETSQTKDGRAYRQSRGESSLPTALPQALDNAAVVAYLLSDYSVGIRGQVVRMDPSGLSLMAHPGLLPDTVEAGSSWTFGTVKDAFDRRLTSLQVPLGVVPVRTPALVVSEKQCSNPVSHSRPSGDLD